MPYVRRRKFRSRRRRPIRRRTRRTRRTRVKRSVPSRTHLFRRIQEAVVTHTTTSSGDILLTDDPVIAYALTSFQSADFTGLFDHYKIIGLNVRITLNGSPAIGGRYPTLYVKPDIDDDNSEAVTSMRQSGRTVTREFSETRRSMNFRCPTYMLTGAFGIDSTDAGAVLPRKSPWLNCGAPAIQHGCLKYQMTASANTSYTFSILCTAILAFRDSR